VINPLYGEYIRQVVGLLKARLGDGLVSVVLFGSVARGEADEGSDVDLLVVSEGFKGSLGGRFQIFQEIDRDLLRSEARKRLRREGYGTLISPIPLSPGEVEGNPPILLDLLTDGVILYDRGGFMKGRLAELERRLRALKARRVRLRGGGWYWDLKPDYRLGEVVEF